MVAIVPYQRLVIETALPPQQAVALLSSEVANPPRGLILRPTNVGRFEGTVSNTGFQINRGLGHRNSFAPFLYGTFHPLNGGTQIRVTFRLHSIVAAFLALWCVPWCLLYSFQGSSSMLTCLGLFFLLYLFVLVFFSAELGNSLKLLKEIYGV
jgi:hypothetical protein